jgi:transposase-like protein
MTNNIKPLRELPFGLIRQRRSRDYYLASKENVRVTCKKCGIENTQSQGKMRKFHSEGYVCSSCNKKGKDELMASRLALAKRKLEMKKK